MGSSLNVLTVITVKGQETMRTRMNMGVFYKRFSENLYSIALFSSSSSLLPDVNAAKAYYTAASPLDAKTQGTGRLRFLNIVSLTKLFESLLNEIIFLKYGTVAAKILPIQ